MLDLKKHRDFLDCFDFKDGPVTWADRVLQIDLAFAEVSNFNQLHLCAANIARVSGQKGTVNESRFRMHSFVPSKKVKSPWTTLLRFANREYRVEYSISYILMLVH